LGLHPGIKVREGVWLEKVSASSCLSSVHTRLFLLRFRRSDEPPGRTCGHPKPIKPKEIESMAREKQLKLAYIGVFSLIVLSELSAVAFAENVKLQGIIKGRSGATMTVQ